MRRIINIILLVICIILTTKIYAFSMDIEAAVTVDLSLGQEDLPPNKTQMDVIKKILLVFKKHHIKEVYAFVEGEKIENNKQLMAILKKWVDDGQFLANRTYSHKDPEKSTLNDYIADVKRNEIFLNQFMPNKNNYYFRFPYLLEGDTQVKYDNVRQVLHNNGYKIVPISIYNFDNDWNKAYVKCITQHDRESTSWVKNEFFNHAKYNLTYAYMMPRLLYKHKIKLIYSIHATALTADTLDKTLTYYENIGVKFISLPNALSDEAYNYSLPYQSKHWINFLTKVRMERMIVPMLFDEVLPDNTKLENLCENSGLRPPFHPLRSITLCNLP